VPARRAFLGTLASGLLAAPLVAEAQQAAKVPRICVLEPVILIQILSWKPFGRAYARLGTPGAKTSSWNLNGRKASWVDCPISPPSWSGARLT